MNESRPSIHEGTNYPTPITRVLALGYYDGPTDGLLQCGDDGPVYRFDLLAGPFSREDGDGLWDLRIFRLAPLSPVAWTQLVEAFQRYWTPRWPVWVPIWDLPTAADDKNLRRFTDQVLSQARPMEWVVASFDLMDEVRAARPVTTEEAARVTDWLAFLGIENEVTVD